MSPISPITQRYHIILASNSPRRRELLKGLGIDFDVKVLPDIDEDYPADILSVRLLNI